MNPSQYTGFSPHVQNQIFNISQDSRSRGHARTSRAQYRGPRAGRHLPFDPERSINAPLPNPSNGWGTQQNLQQDVGAFPPLVSSQTAMPSQGTLAANAQSASQTSARDFFERARGGNYRGRGRRQQHQPFQYEQGQMQNPVHPGRGNFHRPPSNQNVRLYHPSSNAHFGTAEQQRAHRHRLMEQSDYLNYVSQLNLKNLLGKEEQLEKHTFRKELEAIAKDVIASLQQTNTTEELEDVNLECYGSLANSFGVAGCDVDLMLTIQTRSGQYADISEEIKRVLEKSILDVGYGARLLTNTRIPILRVCQRPSPELLNNLRQYRQNWEQSLKDKELPSENEGFGELPRLSEEQQIAAATALMGLEDFNAAEIPLPPSPIPEQAKLEYVSDCGVQCDINFTNHVALHNTKLLWTYGQCDIRVRQMGIFVKNWAKARDINTPYRGTLSSYGYIIMVIHYLMNIAQPPLIPNLQQRARDKDAWFGKPVELFESFDVRFTRDMQEVKAAVSELPKNHESLGSLLRGFFAYYATGQGFNWTQDLISIRTPGGVIPKRAKAWTEAKWSAQKQNVRLRYLCAIEDPFEIDHNIARTVGHSGIVAIRDEFRRAWRIIESIHRDPQSNDWVWSNRETMLDGKGEELIEHVENRGDLLKKDHEERKQKLRQMKQDLEAREEELKRQALESNSDVVEVAHEKVSNGMCDRLGFQMSPTDSNPDKDFLKLMHDRRYQDSKWKKIQGQIVSNRRQVQESEGSTSLQRKACHYLGLIIKSKPYHVNLNPYLQIYEQSVNEVQTDLKALDPRKLSIKKVIAWNRESEGGRWLLWRDKCILKGSWRPPNHGAEAKLNARFPYDPNLTPTKLAQSNAILQKFYLHSLHPRILKEEFSEERNIFHAKSSDENTASPAGCANETNEQCSETSDSEKCTSSIDKEVSSRNPAHEDTLHRGTKIAPPEQDHVNDSGINSQAFSRASPCPEQVLNFVRAKRLTFFTNALDLVKRDHTPAHIENMPTQQDSTAITMPKENLSQKDSGVEGSWNAPSSGSSVIPSSRKSRAFKISDQGHTGENSKLRQLENQADDHKSEERATEFSLMLSQVSKLKIYRRLEEDLTILPIPMHPRFRLDPRQLVDIKIIEAGGNPCAIKGCEFSLESSEMSWGGGGRMAMVQQDQKISRE